MLLHSCSWLAIILSKQFIPHRRHRLKMIVCIRQSLCRVEVQEAIDLGHVIVMLTLWNRAHHYTIHRVHRIVSPQPPPPTPPIMENEDDRSSRSVPRR